jgi:hypothetical protein
VNKSQLLEALFTLLDRMNHRKNGESNGMLERYNYFIYNSEHGRDCKYAARCLDIFLSEDYEDVRKLFLECLSEYRLVEGKDFGK